MFKEIYKEMRNCEYPFYIWGNGSMAHVVYNCRMKEFPWQAILLMLIRNGKNNMTT